MRSVWWLIPALLTAVKNSEAKKYPPPIHIRTWLPFNHMAVCLPPYGIYIRSDQINNTALLEHEIIHWKQYQERGLLNYYTDYAKDLPQGYDNHPMEIEARFNESEYCKQNYTDCVRSGQSNTVYNPNFRK